MASRFSAYLSIFNDWDILPAALASIASRVDELVVVDGAYDWMIPYLKGLGVDPARSDRRVYDAIEASGIPFRVICRTWKNEPEKRQFGYEACRHRYIYRVDADEVLFFDDGVLETALSRGFMVGEMEMPNYVAPGWISRNSNADRIERQCFLFDREQVSSEIHLNYLWLLLTADTLPQPGVKPFPVYSEPIAFNAHLTGWRTPASAVSRAAFYILNWMRQNGVPWIPTLRDKPLIDLHTLFDLVQPSDFMSSLKRGRIAFGMVESGPDRIFVPSPLGGEQEACLASIYQNFLQSLEAVNVAATLEEQPFLTSFPVLLDLSTPSSRCAVAPNGTVLLRVSAPLLAAKTELITYTTTRPYSDTKELLARIDGPEFQVELPTTPTTDTVLRQCLEFQIWPNSQDLLQRFRVQT